MRSQINFGYAWYLTYGHLLIAIPAAAVALWAFAGFAVMRWVFDFNSPMQLPATSFLASGGGRVLDIGAGTGRSAIALLEARPRATLVAIDRFERSYTEHFGKIGDGRITENLRAAGVLDRATVQKADMRELPFTGGEFDAALSVFAIDHTSSEGIRKALAEAARVVKPGGEFLMVVMHRDRWMRLAFGPFMRHVGTRSAATWQQLLDQAGFTVVEQGPQPGALYFLARRR
jgi:ubiquinone/menaquinone biosynthesis C-methylase UbiE